MFCPFVSAIVTTLLLLLLQQSVCLCVLSAAATFVLFSLCLFVLAFCFVSAFDSFSSLHFGVAMIGIRMR